MWQWLKKRIGWLLGLGLVWDLAARLAANILWFAEVGYLAVFWWQLAAQIGVGAIAFFVSASYLLGNLALAERWKYPAKAIEKPPEGVKAIALRWLLPIVFFLTLVVSIIVLHYGKAVIEIFPLGAWYWYPHLPQTRELPNLPLRLGLISLREMGRSLSNWWVQGAAIAGLGGMAIALIFNSGFWLRAIAIFLSLLFSLLLSSHWARFLQFLYPTNFGSTDPLFGQDLSFYIFQLPIWELLEFWLVGLSLYALIASLLAYLLSADSLSQGIFPGFSPSQQSHLSGLGGVFALSISSHYILNSYELLYSARGVAYGASYTDVNVELPLNGILAVLTVAIAISLFGKAVFENNQKRQKNHLIQSFTVRQYLWQLVIRRLFIFSPLRTALAIFALLFLASLILPNAVQKLVVQPNELAREQPYIQRSISFTRQAFDLKEIEIKTFDPQGKLTLADIKKNDLTIRNIRLWDTRPLLKSNRQLQQIRLYYKFPNADIDRYNLIQEETTTVGGIGTRDRQPLPTSKTEKRQVILAARELDYSAVPPEAQTWVNEHLVYTHGYGFTLSPVNTVAPGGLPDYFIKDIGSNQTDSNSILTTASQQIRDSIPISHPRIYYGEITNTYTMTPTRLPEFDYPSGNDNVYNTYDGSGGVVIGQWWRRLLFAQYLKDWQMLLTNNFNSQTKLLFRRNINQRVRTIAPWLRYDSDPYLAVVDAGEEANNYLYWIIDGYTTSDRYPYSEPSKEKFNYIRNSVKVVVDAYNGSVNFYVSDSADPIVKTWIAIFPNLFKPLTDMPPSLREHLRYPADFFRIQSEQLRTYHMTDPQVFYNREDLWQIPNEIYGGKPQPVEPYYLIMNLPIVAERQNTTSQEEFILLLPFTPNQRTNLIAWLVARSDGEEYGKLLLYKFPKQQLVYGTEQIEALINQDPAISQQISLWNRQGSKAVQGNLLVIPIERSLLYVEPLYLEAEQNSLPTLARVIVVYENKIAMAETLEKALQAIFVGEKSSPPPIVSPVQ